MLSSSFTHGKLLFVYAEDVAVDAIVLLSDCKYWYSDDAKIKHM